MKTLNFRNVNNYKLKVIGIIALFVCSCSTEGNEEKAPLTNYLNYGIYDVGFKTLFETDLSRESVPYSDGRGKLYFTDLKDDGRTLPIHIWYPSKTAYKQLRFQHYLNLIAFQSSKQNKSESHLLSQQIFIDLVNDLKGDVSFSQDQLDTLLNLKTKAFLNAQESEGQFPLIIFPNGTSPANQSIMCEYLASHGYVVAALPLKGQFSHVIDASIKGLEVAVDDLEFALQKLLQFPNVNVDEIALLANAIESTFCAGLVSRNQKIKALVSLEGGFLSRFNQDILDKSNFYEPQNVTIPILSIYAPHPAISPEYIHHLKHSERYFAHFPEMTEFHFLNFGIFDEYVPDIIGKPKGDTKEGFRVASELILSFLDAKLKNKPETLEKIYSSNFAPPNMMVIDSLYKLKGIPVSPNLAILKNLFIKNGMPSIDSIYRSHFDKGNEKPFPLSFYNDFRTWLAWKKDPKYVNRKSLYEMAVQSYPRSAINNYYYASFLVKTAQTSSSKEYYLRASELIEDDHNISKNLKTSLKVAINKALDSIN